MKKVMLSALLVVGMTFPALGEILKSEGGTHCNEDLRKTR